MAHESAAETATRLRCSPAFVVLHHRPHTCYDGALITRPPCLLTDPSRHDELETWMTSTTSPTKENQ